VTTARSKLWVSWASQRLSEVEAVLLGLSIIMTRAVILAVVNMDVVVERCMGGSSLDNRSAGGIDAEYLCLV